MDRLINLTWSHCENIVIFSDVSIKNATGATPLHLATEPEITSMLLDASADPNVVDLAGNSPVTNYICQIFLLKEHSSLNGCCMLFHINPTYLQCIHKKLPEAYRTISTVNIMPLILVLLTLCSLLTFKCIVHFIA